MIDLQKLLNNLSNSQKEELKNMLLNDNLELSGNTDKVIYCPKCKSFHVSKNGKVSNNQRFICKDCGTHFTEYRNTIFNRTKKGISLWKSYIREMFSGKTIKQIALKLSISIQTSFTWRHKIMRVIENKCSNDILNGIVEADETFVLLSHKGKHIEGVKPRKRGGKANYRGISHEQQGILVAVDRNYNIVSKVYGNGKIASQDVKSVLNNRVESKSVLVTDGCTAYNDFAKDNDLELVKLVKTHKKGIYHINNVNNYHSLMKDFLRKFKGISSRYLNEYLSWFKFIRQVNDTGILYNNVLLGN